MLCVCVCVSSPYTPGCSVEDRQWWMVEGVGHWERWKSVKWINQNIARILGHSLINIVLIPWQGFLLITIKRGNVSFTFCFELIPHFIALSIWAFIINFHSCACRAGNNFLLLIFFSLSFSFSFSFLFVCLCCVCVCVCVFSLA